MPIMMLLLIMIMIMMNDDADHDNDNDADHDIDADDDDDDWHLLQLSGGGSKESTLRSGFPPNLSCARLIIYVCNSCFTYLCV